MNILWGDTSRLCENTHTSEVLRSGENLGSTSHTDVFAFPVHIKVVFTVHCSLVVYNSIVSKITYGP